VLARLDEIPGVNESRAECSGHYFIIILDDDANDRIHASVLEVLGRGARVLPTDEAGVQHEARRRGEPWLTSAEARSLSFVEGRMLGGRVSAAIASELGLSAEERERLAEAVREEMFAHVERIYAGRAQAGRFFEAWPQIAADVAKRCAHWLGADRVMTVTSSLVRHFPPPHHRER
jgi:hypothetical protein